MEDIRSAFRDLFNSNNEFFELARTGKRITHIALAIPILIVFLLGGYLFSELIIFQLILQNPPLPRVFKEFYGLAISFGFVVFTLWLWVRFFEKRSFRTLGFTKGGAFKKYITGFLSGLLMLSSVIGLMAIFGVIRFNENHEAFHFQFIGVMILLLLGYVVQGATEEIIARGWQFQVIGARYKPWLGALISSVIFALLHGMNPGISPIAFMNLLLFAFLLILFILYHQSIWAACGWHTAWNWAMENIYGLEVSGTKGTGSVLNLSAEGSKYLTGGGFGPEGSILTTFVLLIGMVVIIVLKSKQK